MSLMLGFSKGERKGENRLDANTFEVVRWQRSQPENKRAITEAPGYSEANANYPPVRAALEPRFGAVICDLSTDEVP